MEQRTVPQQLVRDLVARRHRAAEGTIRVRRERIAGINAVLAVTFDDDSGDPRGALIGLAQDGDGVWHSTGGSSGRRQDAAGADLWTLWGGWGPADPAGTAAVVGGWVADPNAVTARLTDPAGRTVQDRIENQVAILFWTDEFNVRDSYLELLAADGQVSRSGPLYVAD
jgi:hypothetical protein